VAGNAKRTKALDLFDPTRFSDYSNPLPFLMVVWMVV